MGVVLGTLLFLSGLELLSPRYFCWDDNATYFLPAYHFNYHCLVEQGSIPLIDFNQFLGQTHLAQGQNGVLYPPAYFAEGLSQFICGTSLWTIDLLVGIHLLMGAIGFYFFLRTMAAAASVAMVGSWLYVTMPYGVLISKNWIFVAYLAGFAPWAFLLVERMLRSFDWKTGFIYALVKALFFYQGYLQYSFYLVFFECLHAGFSLFGKPPASWRRFSVQYGGGNFLSLLLVLPLLVPMQEAVALSASRSRSMGFAQLLVFSVDPILGAGAQFWVFVQEAFFLMSSRPLFCGGSLVFVILLLRMVLAGEVPARRLCQWIFLLIAAIAFSTRLYGVLAWMPPFNVFRWPFKWYFFVSFFYSIGFVMLLAQGYWGRRLRSWTIFVLLLLAVFSNLAVLIPEKARVAFSTHRLEKMHELDVSWWKNEGRVLNFEFPDDDFSNPGLMGYNFPMMVNRRGFAGYDQLVSAQNSRLALGINIWSSYRFPLKKEDLEHLSSWNVRYFTTVSTEEHRAALSGFEGVELMDDRNGIAVFENRNARPFAAFESERMQSVPVTWGVNEFSLDANGKSGSLRLAMAAIPHFKVQYDQGVAMALAVSDSPLLLTVPPGTRVIRVFYEYPHWNFLLAISGVAFGLMILALIVQSISARLGERP